MDPTVTQPDTGDIKGDIQLSLKYNHKQQLLLVKVIRARDLVPRDLNGKYSTFFSFLHHVKKAWSYTSSKFTEFSYTLEVTHIKQISSKFRIHI